MQWGSNVLILDLQQLQLSFLHVTIFIAKCFMRFTQTSDMTWTTEKMNVYFPQIYRLLHRTESSSAKHYTASYNVSVIIFCYHYLIATSSLRNSTTHITLPVCKKSLDCAVKIGSNYYKRRKIIYNVQRFNKSRNMFLNRHSQEEIVNKTDKVF